MQTPNNLPTSFRGVPDLGLQLYIKHGQLQVNGVGKTVYSPHRSPRAVQTGASGYAERAAGRLAMMDSIGGEGNTTNGLITLPAPGLIIETATENVAETTWEVSNKFAGNGTYSADATDPKPGGGASNKVTIIDGGALIEHVILWNGEGNVISGVDGSSQKVTVIFRAKASQATNVNVLFRVPDTAPLFINNCSVGSNTITIALTTTWKTFALTLTTNAMVDDYIDTYLCFDVGAGGLNYDVWFSGATIHLNTRACSPQEYNPGANVNDFAYVEDNSNQIRLDEGTLLIRGFVPFWQINDYFVAGQNQSVHVLATLYVNYPGGAVNFAQIRRVNQTDIRWTLQYGAHAFIGEITTTVATPLLQYKFNNLAYSWRNGAQAAALNGVIVGTNTADLSDIASKYITASRLTMGRTNSGSVPSSDGLFLEGADNGVFSFRRALSQSELIALTRRENIFS